MTLFIAINGEYNKKLMEHLFKFYNEKQYKITIIEEQGNDEANYILNNTNLLIHQKLQLTAYNRSKTYYNNNYENYQLVIFTGSIIDDYTLIQDTDIPTTYVKKLNSYQPVYDLYITIGECNVNLNKQYNHKIIPNDSDVFENLVKTIFDNLPRCNWCGKLFKPNKTNYKYCSKKCSKYSLEEQMRINNRNYYHKYKDVLTEKQKGALGSKNANLHGTADPNPFTELEKVRRAKKSLGLRNDLFK